jgi:uncharacterized Zn-finger protein
MKSRRKGIQKKDSATKCPVCYLAISKASLSRHIRTIHDMERPHKCDDCDAAFTQIASLRFHIDAKHNPDRVPQKQRSPVNPEPAALQQHPGEPRRECPTCKKEFSTRHSMVRHYKIEHEGLKPFKCDLCEYKTGERSKLRIHIERHHTGPPRDHMK